MGRVGFGLGGLGLGVRFTQGGLVAARNQGVEGAVAYHTCMWGASDLGIQRGGGRAHRGTCCRRCSCHRCRCRRLRGGAGEGGGLEAHARQSAIGVPLGVAWPL